MKSLSKILASTAAVACALAGTAGAASAQPYDYRYDDRYDDDRYDDRYDRDRGGISVGDIATGVAAVGAIAGVVNAVTGRGGYYGAPYGYGVPRYGYPPAYGYPQGSYGYGNAYGAYGYGAGAAVNSCSIEAQRYARGGQVQVRDVDPVSGGRFRVRGVFQELQQDRWGRVRAEREGFSCLAYGNGQIQDFDS